jgi:endonuclease-3
MDIHAVMSILKTETQKFKTPIVTQYAQEERNPFKVLISTILSLRTKDSTTAQATERLFSLATTPETMQKLTEKQIQDAIYPVGFYITKAKRIKEVCNMLVEQYNSIVPDTIEMLLTLPGVGRKTANLVITQGYNKLGICVDTHVHKVSNRLGYIKTKTPEETEFRLRKILPKQYWIVYNDYLVAWGQNICKSVSPLCSKCNISAHCKKAGVKKHR